MARDYDGGNTTGFVSPAGDSLEGPIDLSEILDLRRPHRYPVRVKGDALAERGIQHGDILIADAAATPTAGRVVIAMIHGDVLVCQLAFRHGQWWLRPSGVGKEPLPVRDEAEIWAVVAAAVGGRQGAAAREGRGGDLGGGGRPGPDQDLNRCASTG